MNEAPVLPMWAGFRRDRRPRAALRFMAVGALLLATAAPSVLAEDLNPAAFFRADRERLKQLQQRP